MNDTYTPAFGTPQKLTREYVFRLLGTGFAVAVCVMGMIVLTMIYENVFIFYAFILLMIAGVLLRLHLRNKICSFSADDNEVVFKTVFRTCHIAYDDIEKMEISREIMTREEGRYHRYRFFAEKLTITTSRGKKTFARQMDADIGLVTKDPEKLKQIFEDSKFSRLKRFIEEKKAG